jgi:hypothetical protein
VLQVLVLFAPGNRHSLLQARDVVHPID